MQKDMQLVEEIKRGEPENYRTVKGIIEHPPHMYVDRRCWSLVRKKTFTLKDLCRLCPMTGWTEGIIMFSSASKILASERCSLERGASSSWAVSKTLVRG